MNPVEVFDITFLLAFWTGVLVGIIGGAALALVICEARDKLRKRIEP